MAKKLTSAQAQAVLGCSHMALLAWRKGSTKRDPLPVAKQKPSDTKTRILFNVSDLKRWAKKYGIELLQDPDKLADESSSDVKKPGPKVPAKKATVAAKKVVAKKAATAIHQVTKKPAKATVAAKKVAVKPAAVPAPTSSTVSA